MSKLDLALINGNNWSAAHVDAVEAGINLVRINGTNAERVAMSGVANGQGFYCTDTLIEWRYNGAAWVVMNEPPTTWTPALTTGTGTAFSMGNAVTDAWYQRHNGICTFGALIVFGSTTTYGSGGNIRSSLPVAPSGNFSLSGFMLNASDGYKPADLYGSASGSIVDFRQSANATNAYLTNIYPFTLANASQMFFHGSYRMA